MDFVNHGFNAFFQLAIPLSFINVPAAIIAGAINGVCAMLPDVNGEDYAAHVSNKITGFKNVPINAVKGKDYSEYDRLHRNDTWLRWIPGFRIHTFLDKYCHGEFVHRWKYFEAAGWAVNLILGFVFYLILK